MNKHFEQIRNEKNYLHRLISQKNNQPILLKQDSKRLLEKKVSKVQVEKMSRVEDIDCDYLFDNFDRLFEIKSIAVPNPKQESIRKNLNLEFENQQKTIEKKSSLYLTNQYLQQQQTKDKLKKSVLLEKGRSKSFTQKNSYLPIINETEQNKPVSNVPYKRKILPKPKKNYSIYMNPSLSLLNHSRNKSNHSKQNISIETKKEKLIKPKIPFIDKENRNPKQRCYLNINKPKENNTKKICMCLNQTCLQCKLKKQVEIKKKQNLDIFIPTYKSKYEKVLQQQQRQKSKERSLSQLQISQNKEVKKKSIEKSKSKKMNIDHQNALLVKNRFNDFIDLLLK